MNKTLRILFLSLLAALCLGLAACSDSGDDLNGGTAKDYEVNDYYTDLLRQDWKITEHEYADKSYYTKDFKTSWVINSPFRYGGNEYCPFNYKLSLQSEINYVEEVEVGTYPDGEDWIVDLGTGRRLFAIEDLHYGGNYYVMILRDTAGNRFRCHSITDACVYFVENATDHSTLKVKYIRTIDSAGSTVANVDYSVAALPRNAIGAYAILVEKASGVELELTAADGNGKKLTSSNLSAGWNRGAVNANDIPGETPDEPNTGDRDTEMEKQILGAWADLGYSNFIFYYNIDGTYIQSFRCYGNGFLMQDYEQVEITNGSNGQKVSKHFVATDYRPYTSMTVCFHGENPSMNSWSTVTYIKKAKAVYFKNNSSYKTLNVKYTRITSNSGASIYLQTETSTNQKNTPFALIAVDQERFNDDWIVNAEITAYNDYSTDAVTINYTYTVPANAPEMTCIEITDADFSSSPNTDDDIAKLEAFIWKRDKIQAWRIDKIAYDGKTFEELSPYAWLITECDIQYQQGLHIGRIPFSERNFPDANYYIKKVEDKLILTPWYTANSAFSFEIITPVSEIISTGNMVLRNVNNKLYLCSYSEKPIIAYCHKSRNDNQSYYLSQYEITETNTYGRPVDVRTFNYKEFASEFPNSYNGAFCLLADEVTNPGNGNFTVEAQISFTSYTFSDLKLGSVVRFDFPE